MANMNLIAPTTTPPNGILVENEVLIEFRIIRPTEQDPLPAKKECDSCSTPKESSVAGPTQDLPPPGKKRKPNSSSASASHPPPTKKCMKSSAKDPAPSLPPIGHVIRHQLGFKCTICGKEFTSRSNRSYHRYCDKSFKKPFQCGTCERVSTARTKYGILIDIFSIYIQIVIVYLTYICIYTLFSIILLLIIL